MSTRLCPNLSLVEVMPRLFMLELCLTCYSPDLRECLSEPNTLRAHNKTHSWADTRHTLLTPLQLKDIALDLLRITHKSGLDEMITTQDLTMGSYGNVYYSLLLAKYTIYASAD